MTFQETMGQVADRLGRRVRVVVAGRSDRGPAVAVDARGTLAPGWPFEHLDAVNANLDSGPQAFAFEEAPDVRVLFDPDEFRDAQVSGDRLAIHLGEDLEVTIEPALDL